MTGDALTAATALFDLEPGSVRCPYPIFDALRDESPVVWSDRLEAYIVSSYDLIVEVLRQPERFSSKRTVGPAIDRQVGGMMREIAAEGGEVAALLARTTKLGTAPVLVRADPPDHGRQRALVNRAFRPATIRALEPAIEELVEDLVDAFAPTGRVDLAHQLSLPLPMIVIARALGVTLDRMDDFRRWSDSLVLSFGRSDLAKDDLREVVRARSEMAEYLLGVIDEREEDPADDLVSQIVTSQVDGERLSRYEIVEMVMQFLIAGNETTAKLINAAGLRLALDEALADRLRADPELVVPFLEEVLRLEPPSSGLYRTATVDCELGGVALPAGTNVWLVYAAGNRDPEHFDDPGTCRLDRTESTPHLGFGLGPHYCLGAGLARAEARIAVQALLRRCHRLRLAVPADAVSYDPSYLVHGIHELPLTFEEPPT